MPSGKIELKKGELTVDAQNVLATARPEKLIAISPFQIRTHIDLKSLDLQSPDQLKVLKAVGDEAKKFTKEAVDEVQKLVTDLKALVKKDAEGDASAGGKAKALVEKVSGELEDKLPDFGRLMRKAVERSLRKKLSTTNKSVSTGGFKGLKLTVKFTSSDNGLDVEVDDEARKWLVANNEEIQLQKAKAAIAKDGVDSDLLNKFRDKIYEIKCARSTKHMMVGLVQGDKFALQAVYETAGGAKTKVAGEDVPGYGS